MLGILLCMVWTLSLLPAMLVMFLFMEKNRPRDGIAACVTLILIGPITMVAFLSWALYRTARLLLGLVHMPTASKSNPRENVSS